MAILISEQFKRVFPFVTDIRIRPAQETVAPELGSDVYVALIKERGIEKPVLINEIASGMQKVLLIITDIVTAPADLLYMIRAAVFRHEWKGVRHVGSIINGDVVVAGNC